VTEENGGQRPRRWFPTEPTRPLAVSGGLKARSTRGAIGQTWWSGRFIAVLEAIIVGGRLERGRNYARRGQVLSMDVAAGMVSALVQGSRVQPYRVRIGLDAFGAPQWDAAERALAASAWYSAKLLAGEMPEDIDEVFAELGLALFPASAAELSMYCSCPDWEVPCKHIAAVFYLLAEAFDDDPFSILAWRGRSREDLLAGLHAARGGVAAGPGGPDGVPLADCLGSFFAMPVPLPVTSPPAAASTSILDQLPELRLAVRGRPLAELLRPAYDCLAEPPSTPAPPPGTPPS
jgi:uncharacterized Zn finger protein